MKLSRAGKVAVSAAREAGAILRQSFGHTGRDGVKYKAHREPVSLVDFASNDLIIQRISKAFPTHDILSEENPGSATQPITSRPTWVIDPLDGTTNFISGVPLFAVAIALVERGVPRVGVIYDPIHDELFVAERGKGAWLNGKRMHVSKRDVVRGALLYAGRGYRDHDLEKHGKIIYELERRTSYFRRLGTAAIMLAYVAAGRTEAVILTGNKPWDTLAGIILVREAGGAVTDYCGCHWTIKSEDVVATNKSIHKHLVNITKRIKAAKCRKMTKTIDKRAKK